MNQVMNNILSLDLGRKHVGVALFRERFGVQTLSSFSYKQIFDFKTVVASLLQEYQISILVVGDMGNDMLPAQLERTLHDLCEREKVELVIVGERYSSLQAEHEVYSTGGKVNKQSHSSAAETILRDYLTVGSV